ncbi:MAG: outer membrane beta-barrel protein [Acidobacteriota bacterium]
MQRILCLTVLLACCAPLALAQKTTKTNDYPKYNWFIGYSALGEGNEDDGKILTRFGSNSGVETSAARYFNKYFGVKGDFSAHFGTNRGHRIFTLDNTQPPITNASLDFSFKHQAYSLLIGPEFRASNRTRLTPFAHALVGGGYDRGTVKLSGLGANGTFNIADSGFAAAVGGGIDIKVAERFSFRTSMDYNPVCPGSKDYDPRGCRDHVRISVGIVFH